MKIDKRIINHLKENGFKDAAKFLLITPLKFDLSNYRLIVGGEESIWKGFEGKTYYQFYFGEKEGTRYVNDCHDEKVVEILEEMWHDNPKDISIQESESQHMVRIPEGYSTYDIKNELIKKFKNLGADVVEEEFN